MSLKKTRYRNVYRRRSGVYVYRFKDDQGRKVQRTGTRSLDTTEKLRRASEDKAAEIRAGLNDPIADQQRIDSERPINEIIDAYCEYLAGKLRTTHHVRTTKNYIKKVVEAIGAKCLADIDALKVDVFLADLVDSGRSIRTRNGYLTAIKALVRWAKDRNMISVNTLSVVHKENDLIDPRRPNRALAVGELARLFEVVDAKYRAYYMLAGRAGLRWEEIKKLRWQDVDLDNAEIKLDPRNTKTKQAGPPLPMTSDLLTSLIGIKPEYAQSIDPIFGFKPDRRTWKRHLAKAEIPYEDDRGRIADRKCLRSTFITHLALKGVDPRIVQRLARHKDINITMNYYTDPYLLDMQGAIEELVDVSPICHREKEIGATKGNEGQRKKVG